MIMGGVSKYSYEYVKDYIESRGCILLSDTFKNVDLLLDIIFSCGHRGHRRFYNFMTGSTYLCAKCSGSVRFSIDDVNEYLEQTDLICLSKEYKDNMSKLSLIDSQGYKYYVSFTGIKQYVKRRNKGIKAVISKIDISNIYTLYNIKNWIKIEDKKYELIGGEFLGAMKKTLLLKCNICNHEWITHWNFMSTGHGCPLCNFSKGEWKVKRFLEKNNISHKIEHQFKDCINVLPLAFDFYLDAMNICIEYQGKQHYEPVSFNGMGFEKACENYEYGLKNDNIKRNYCKENNIRLIEIPYWDYKKLELILEKELNL